MRIALLHPTFWPEVRRGSERVAHDLAAALATRGHDVTVLTSHRARTTVSREDGFEVVRSYRPPTRPLHQLGFEYQLTNAPAAALKVARGRFDVAHALYHVDAVAALAVRRLGGPPVVWSCHGIPTEAAMTAHRLRLPILRRATRGSAEVTVLSEAAAADFRARLGREPEVVPGGVDSAAFAEHARGERASVPTLICAASLNDERKRGPLLLSAFEQLRARRPEARLILAGEPDPHLVRGELELPAGVETLHVPDTAALAAAYASAWASVLPSVEEAFGLVLIESLAAGTPAVAARSGACPEILDRPGVGRLFEPDDEASLVEAMDEALDLGAEGAASAECMERAAGYDWSIVASRFERIYQHVAA